MTINTHFGVTDTVWYVNPTNFQPVSSTVLNVRTLTTSGSTNIYYGLNSGHTILEAQAFNSQAALAASFAPQTS